MAGSYPDVPGYRFAYDVDGTIAISETGTLVSSANLKALNTDNFGENWHLNPILVYLFPDLRTITGLFLRKNTSTSITYSWSSDTTTGLDGTWSSAITVSPPQVVSIGTKEDARSNIVSVNLMNVRGLKLTGGGAWRSLHIYGQISPTESKDRLRITDLSNTDVAAQFDLGNIPQRSSTVRQFKVINNSDTKTATNITLSVDITNTATPSLVGQIQVSTDNISYANAVNIGNLTPGQSSSTLYVRSSIAASAQLGVFESRIIAHPVSWS